MANVLFILLAVMIAHQKIDARIRTVPLQKQFANTQVTSSGLIQVKSVRSVLECAMTCTGYSNCQAFNYQKGPQLTKCHMFQSQFFEMKDGNLIPNSNYDYYEVNDCYIKRPCHNGGTCIKPVNSKDGIYCQCRRRFTGQFCENLITTTTSTTMVSNTTSPSTSITSTTFTFTPDTSTTSAATYTTKSITPSATSTSVATTTNAIKPQTATTVITKDAVAVPTTTMNDAVAVPTTTMNDAVAVPTTTVKDAVAVPTTTVKDAVPTSTMTATATVPTTTRAVVTIPTTVTAPTTKVDSATSVASTKTVASTSTTTTQRTTAAIVTATTTQSKAVNYAATTTATLINTATKQLTGTNTTTTALETCNHTKVTFTNSTETFCSDNYPETYLKNLECYWLINVTSTSNITIDFNAVELEYSTNCSRDRIVIYDGATVKDEILETVCGNVTNHTITTSRHMALVQFITGSRLEFSGFNITYSEKVEVVPISKSPGNSQRLSAG